MRLAEIQAAFFARTFASRAAGGPALLLSGEGEPERRLTLYREANIMRLVTGLRLAFPQTASGLGERAFLDAAQAYIEQPIEGHQTHDRLVAGFPRYLKATGDGRPRSDIADLAELEWVRQEVAKERGVAPIGREAVRGLDARSLAEVRLRLVPALRLLPLDSDVFGFWSAIVSATEPPPPRRVPTCFLVWRSNLIVYHSALEWNEANALERARDGACVAEICDAFRDEEAPVDAAHAALESWFADGLVAALERP